jgi:hypothetical protein
MRFIGVVSRSLNIYCFTTRLWTSHHIFVYIILFNIINMLNNFIWIASIYRVFTKTHFYLSGSCK